MSAGDDVARTFPGDESYVLEKLLDDDKDAALDIDVQGVVEEIDPKGTDDETDASEAGDVSASSDDEESQESARFVESPKSDLRSPENVVVEGVAWREPPS